MSTEKVPPAAVHCTWLLLVSSRPGSGVSSSQVRLCRKVQCYHNQVSSLHTTQHSSLHTTQHSALHTTQHSTLHTTQHSTLYCTVLPPCFAIDSNDGFSQCSLMYGHPNMAVYLHSALASTILPCSHYQPLSITLLQVETWSPFTSFSFSLASS